jgi:hypothetical protein
MNEQILAETNSGTEIVQITKTTFENGQYMYHVGFVARYPGERKNQWEFLDTELEEALLYYAQMSAALAAIKEGNSAMITKFGSDSPVLAAK